MATRRTASDRAPVKTDKTYAKAQSSATGPAAGKRATEAAPSQPRATAAGKRKEAATGATLAPQATAAPAEVPAREARYRWIAHAAYLRTEPRGFVPGHEIDGWLADEAELVTAGGAS